MRKFEPNSEPCALRSALQRLVCCGHTLDKLLCMCCNISFGDLSPHLSRIFITTGQFLAPLRFCVQCYTLRGRRFTWQLCLMEGDRQLGRVRKLYISTTYPYEGALAHRACAEHAPLVPPFYAHFVPASGTCCCLKTGIATLRYTTPYIICLGCSSQQALRLWINKK